MLEDATIIIHAMNTLLDKGIGCLSVHDCLIVPKVNTEDAKQAFYSAYGQFHRKRPLLSVEYCGAYLSVQQIYCRTEGSANSHSTV